MKKIVSLAIALVVLLANIAFAEGLLPGISDSFNIAMPSLSRILIRNHDVEETMEDGSLVLTYNDVSEAQFNSFSDYLEQYGCTLDDYTVNGSLMTATVSYMGKTFEFQYDVSSAVAKAIYPYGVVPETLNPILLAEVGDIVPFGHYEQDNDIDNGPESIEWIVLEKTNTSCLLIARYGLDAVRMDSRFTEKKWGETELRNWLNNTFYNEAFSSEEQDQIEMTHYHIGDDPQYYSGDVQQLEGSKELSDKVYILSLSEVYKYFPSDDSRKLDCTPYAVPRRIYADGQRDTNPISTWWTRSKETTSKTSGYYAIKRDGSIYSNTVLGRVKGSVYADNPCVVVRPAITIDLGSFLSH